MEIWKQVSDWPDYEVSTTGLIRKHGRLLIASPSTRHGRLQIRLIGPADHKHFMLARLIYETFKGPIGRHQIAYRDNDPTNCALANLYVRTGISSRVRPLPVFNHQQLWPSLFAEHGATSCLLRKPEDEQKRLDALEKRFQELVEQIEPLELKDIPVDISPSPEWSFKEHEQPPEGSGLLARIL